jgi:hypothetical protein
VQGELNTLALKKGTLTSFFDIEFSLKRFKQASKLLLNISIPELNIQNIWEIWVYPSINNETNGDVYIMDAQDLNSVEKLLKEGKKVLLQLDSSSLESYRESCFTTIFWNSILKWPQKSNTMGILCNPEHAVFNSFPTDYHSNWQWWDITMNAVATDISSLPNEISPLIQVIDSYIVNKKLAYLWEAKVGNGKLMVSTINFTNSMENRLASKQLKRSILEYMNSKVFDPKINIDFAQIKEFATVGVVTNRK